MKKIRILLWSGASMFGIGLIILAIQNLILYKDYYLFFFIFSMGTLWFAMVIIADKILEVLVNK